MEAIKTQEDILECYLYPKSCYTTPDLIDESVLTTEITRFNHLMSTYTKDYMWHCDPLVFHPRTKTSQILESVIQGDPRPPDTSLIPHIVARLRYDEDIGDEWFTVFLIFRLTESLEGLIARLVDSDGEFLLIEGADDLPKWAEPETCQDRVYVANGAVHVVKDEKLVLERLRSLARSPERHLLPEAAQMAIRKRISVYPEEVGRRRHKARAFLPEKAASILAQEPGLIAFAIRTIVHSDPVERRVCRAMRYFPPEQRTMVNLGMTRCLYAMATHCRYTGDPRTGWNFPPTNSPKYSAHLLGIKVACGLEILVARANERRRKREGAGGAGDDDKWGAYLRRLEDCGYFRGCLQGSQERDRLERVAREFLVERPLGLPTQHKDDDAADRILAAWKSLKTEDFEMLAQDEASLSPPDDDSWLNVDAQQLESMLNQHWGLAEKKSQEPTSIKEKIKAFLNQTSDIEGIEFTGEGARDDDPRHDSEEGGRIEFDADVYDSTLRDILDLVVPGGDGEFDGSSEGSLAGDDDERAGEMDKYMRLLDSQLELQLKKDDTSLSSRFKDSTESNLVESMEEEAGGAGPAGNIIGGPVRRLMHLHLQSPTAVPPDLQS
ncbi:protein ecdysoneless [Diachasma alloeum]|uniref:protein ecdysoneless n=1 Tax=Diachasma alloeum TaxID=454923 RepID=UPI00073828FB|nr:protein ecdysoneless [Diachasma alloeum]